GGRAGQRGDRRPGGGGVLAGLQARLRLRGAAGGRRAAGDAREGDGGLPAPARRNVRRVRVVARLGGRGTPGPADRPRLLAPGPRGVPPTAAQPVGSPRLRGASKMAERKVWVFFYGSF